MHKSKRWKSFCIISLKVSQSTEHGSEAMCEKKYCQLVPGRTMPRFPSAATPTSDCHVAGASLQSGNVADRVPCIFSSGIYLSQILANSHNISQPPIQDIPCICKFWRVVCKHVQLCGCVDTRKQTPLSIPVVICGFVASSMPDIISDLCKLLKGNGDIPRLRSDAYSLCPSVCTKHKGDKLS